jgi:peptidoglycan/LPS O-acetylase OafA/YrhL
LCLYITNERIESELGDSGLSLIGSIIIVSAVAILIADNIVQFHARIWITEVFGRLTYPIYMLHMVIGTGFIKFGISLGLSFSVSFIVTLSILVVISAIYLYLVEDIYIQTLKKNTIFSLRNLVT